MKNWAVLSLPGMECINISNSQGILIGGWRHCLIVPLLPLTWRQAGSRPVSMFRVEERARVAFFLLFQFLPFFLALPSTVHAQKRVILNPAPATVHRAHDELCRCPRSPRAPARRSRTRFSFRWHCLFSSVKTDDKRTIFGASMKETGRGLLFSVILLFREKSADKATLHPTALTSLTSVGPSSALRRRCHPSRRVSVALHVTAQIRCL